MKRTGRCARLLAISAMLTMVPAARAATITVDAGGGGDFATIQAGIDSAAVGDTVLVAPGTYLGPGNKNLSFNGKDILLLSSGGAAVTIIDGESSGRAFTFNLGETSAAVVDGFTITRAPTGSPLRIVSGSSPTIRDCVVRHNDVVAGSGGGVFIQASSPSFLGCVFAENTCTGSGGGAAVQGGSPSFVDCAFVGNFAEGRGGGAWLDGVTGIGMTGCTIVGNRANLSGAGFNGGGLCLTGTTTATVSRTILWGNRANLGDEAFVAGTAAITFDCCDLDSTGLGGAGSFVIGPMNIYVDPHFCRPAYCREKPWTYGDYGLAANSPCLPPFSPCGLRIGAFDAGCADVVVWTGGAGTTAWTDSLNWSTGTLPGPTDHVQLTQGSVELDAEVFINQITQCPESAWPDTLSIVAGGILHYAAGGLAIARDAPISNHLSGSGRNFFGEVICDGCGGQGCRSCACCAEFLLTPEATWEVLDGHFTGDGWLVLEGRMDILGPGSTSTIDFDLLNRGNGLSGQPPTGLYVQEGALALSGVAENVGLLSVSPGATFNVSGDLLNADGADFQLHGNLIGSGVFANLGTFERSNPPQRAPGDTSLVAVSFLNDRDTAAGHVGTLTVRDGVMRMTGTLTNRGEMTIAPGATLGLPGTVENLADGVVTMQGGAVLGPGTFRNVGTLVKSGSTSATITSLVQNRFDPFTGDRGSIDVDGGSLSFLALENGGDVAISAGATADVGGSLLNRQNAVIGGSGTIDVSSATVTNAGEVAPGVPPQTGSLDWMGDWMPAPPAELHLEIGGTVAGAGYDQLHVTGSAVYEGALHVSLRNGFLPTPGDTFAVITTTGPIAPGGAVALPDFGCFSGLQYPGGLYLEPVEHPGGLWLIARDTTLANSPPVAVPDTVSAEWPTPVTIAPSLNDGDPDSDTLRLVELRAAGTVGLVYLDPGDSTLTYLPTAGFTGVDSLRYTVTDCAGGLDSATVVVLVIDPTGAPQTRPVPSAVRLDAPFPNPFGSVTRIRFDLPEPADAVLTIYDAAGRRVRRLARGRQAAGIHAVDWWGDDESGRRVAAGVYFVRFETGDRAETRKVVRLR